MFLHSQIYTFKSTKIYPSYNKLELSFNGLQWTVTVKFHLVILGFIISVLFIFQLRVALTTSVNLLGKTSHTVWHKSNLATVRIKWTMLGYHLISSRSLLFQLDSITPIITFPPLPTLICLISFFIFHLSSILSLFPRHLLPPLPSQACWFSRLSSLSVSLA